MQDGALNPATGEIEHYVITTPNMNYIPHFNFHVRSVRAREDGFFGTDDFTRWPQLLVNDFVHSIVIPHKPDDSHPAARIWWRPTRADFKALQGSRYPGLGVLDPSRWDEIQNLQEALSARVKKWQSHPGVPQSHLHVYETAMRLTLPTLMLVPCTFDELVTRYAEFARNYLETQAWLDYLQIYAPRFTGPLAQQHRHVVNPRLLGAFTREPVEVQRLAQCSIPVWYICFESEVSPQINIVKVVEPEMPTLVMLDFATPSRVIYHGFPGKNFHRAMRRLGHLQPVEEMKDVAVSLPVVSEAGPVRTSAVSAGLRPSPCKCLLCPSLLVFLF